MTNTFTKTKEEIHYYPPQDKLKSSKFYINTIL